MRFDRVSFCQGSTARVRRALACVAVAALPGLVRAEDRPLLTEAATTAPAGTLVFESGFDWAAEQPNFLTGRARDVWAGPLLRLTYSPSANAEFDLEWIARLGQRDDPAFGSTSDFGDVSLRAKLRFVEGGRGRPTLGARFAVTLPETSFGDGLGPNTLRLSVQGLLTHSVGRLRLHANAGLALQDEPLRSHEQRDFLAYGFALAYRVTPGVELLGEIAGLAGKGSPGADERSELRFGARLGSGRVRGDAALRIGLADADGTWGVTAGFAYRLRPR